MIINSRQELKDYLRSVIEKFDTKATCKTCHEQGRDAAFINSRLVKAPCCANVEGCEFYKSRVDCKENIKMECLFYFCERLMFRHVELTNFLNRVQASITYPYKSDEYPVEIEDFPKTS